MEDGFLSIYLIIMIIFSLYIAINKLQMDVKPNSINLSTIIYKYIQHSVNVCLYDTLLCFSHRVSASQRDIWCVYNYVDWRQRIDVWPATKYLCAVMVNTFVDIAYSERAVLIWMKWTTLKWVRVKWNLKAQWSELSGLFGRHISKTTIHFFVHAVTFPTSSTNKRINHLPPFCLFFFLRPVKDMGPELSTMLPDRD